MKNKIILLFVLLLSSTAAMGSVYERSINIIHVNAFIIDSGRAHGEYEDFYIAPYNLPHASGVCRDDPILAVTCRQFLCRSINSCVPVRGADKKGSRYVMIQRNHFARGGKYLSVVFVSKTCNTTINMQSTNRHRIIMTGYAKGIRVGKFIEFDCLKNYPFTYVFNYTSYPSWKAVVALLKRAFLSAPSAVEMPANLAALVSKAKGEHKKIILIWQWVAANIKYANTAFNFWNVQPPSETLLLRAGDCKSIVRLMQSLLADIGIRSSIIYVRGYSPMVISPKFYSGVGFNHVVLRVLGKYLVDPTVSPSIYLSLPQYDLQKMAGINVFSGHIVRLQKFPVIELGR